MAHALRSLLLVAVAIAAAPSHAQESRQLNRIATPRAAPALPPGARAISPIRALTPQRIQAIATQIADAWNTPALASMLDEKFYGRDRLLDALQVQAPRDAHLRLLAIEGVQTVGQYLLDGRLVSRVSVTVRTQVEFNDPRTGFQRLEGRNELVVLVTDPAP